MSVPKSDEPALIDNLPDTDLSEMLDEFIQKEKAQPARPTVVTTDKSFTDMYIEALRTGNMWVEDADGVSHDLGSTTGDKSLGNAIKYEEQLLGSNKNYSHASAYYNFPTRAHDDSDDEYPAPQISDVFDLLEPIPDQLVTIREEIKSANQQIDDVQERVLSLQDEMTELKDVVLCISSQNEQIWGRGCETHKLLEIVATGIKDALEANKAIADIRQEIMHLRTGQRNIDCMLEEILRRIKGPDYED